MKETTKSEDMARPRAMGAGRGNRISSRPIAHLKETAQSCQSRHGASPWQRVPSYLCVGHPHYFSRCSQVLYSLTDSGAELDKVVYFRH